MWLTCVVFGNRTGREGDPETQCHHLNNIHKKFGLPKQIPMYAYVLYGTCIQIDCSILK